MDQRNRIKSLEVNPHISSELIFHRGTMNTHGEGQSFQHTVRKLHDHITKNETGL